MRASLLLCLAAALVGAVRTECGGCIDGLCYRKHHLPCPQGNILDIDRNTNTLLIDVYSKSIFSQFQLDTGVGKNTTYRQQQGILMVKVDQRNGDIYGVIDYRNFYKSNLVTNETKLIVSIGAKKLIAFKDRLYYTMWRYGIFTFENGDSQTDHHIVPGSEVFTADNFIVDKNNDIYYETDLNGHAVVRRLSKGVVDWTSDKDEIYNVIVDKDGNAVLITNYENTALYRITDGKPVQVGLIDDVISKPTWYTWPLFDRDNNIIYLDDNYDVIHLKRDEGVNCKISNFGGERMITVLKPEINTTNVVTSTTPAGIETTRVSSADGN